MDMIYLLIPMALMLLGVAVWALIWAIRSGQFEDLDSQGWSVVLDDDEKPPAYRDTQKENESKTDRDQESEH